MKLNPRSSVVELKGIGEKMGLEPIHFTMRDDIYDIPKGFKNVIINLSDDPRSGTHWTCCRILKDKILYFDSFGLIYPLELEEYAKKNNKKIYYNIKQIQSLDNGYCGQYCLLALYCMEHNKDLEDFGLKIIRKFLPLD
jgi:hypothetical protein